MYLIPEKSASGTLITVQMGGLTNPRSFKPTDLFVVTTLDTDGVSEIDDGFNKPATMSIIGEITTVDITPSNFINGEINTYTFTISSPIPIEMGDRLKFKFPKELTPPSDKEEMACFARTNVLSIDCQIAGRDVTITFELVVKQSGGGTYAFTMENIGNPFSTKTSEGFQDITIETAEPYYAVAEYPTASTGITNKLPAPLVTYEANQQDLDPEAITELSISFTPVNALP